MNKRIRVTRTSPEDFMQRPVSYGRVQAAARLSTAGLLAGLFLLPALTGCPGSLGAGNWPTASGSGGSGVQGTGGNTVTGTGGMGAGTGGATAGCDAPTQVFQTSCVGSVCHEAGSPFAGVFSVASTRSSLVGKASMSAAPCAGKPIIDGANPSASVLLTRIMGATCGEQMPSKLVNPNNPPLSQTAMDCVTSWVQTP